MSRLREITGYVDALLEVQKFTDYCPNGLQVEGRGELRTLISGVTASQALLDAAVEANADAVLVHHGYFWRGESPVLTGMKRRRIKTLLENDISLLAYHLPLDAHPQYGNNAALARELGFRIGGVADSGPAKNILFYGELPGELAAEDLRAAVAARLGGNPLLIQGSDRPVRSIAWCTGGAQGYIDEAARLGVDAYLSGEISEQTTHSARENGVHYIAAGHHITERYGVAALGNHLAEKFGIGHRFIDIDNPA
jgi:dinuclear metal center YbgI/SA1388 family protein